MNPEISALLHLLADDDRNILRAVQQRLMALGDVALPALRRAEEHEDPRIRTRCRALRARLERREIFSRLAELAAAENPDLETGAYLLASTHTPSLTRDSVRAALDGLAAAIRPEVEAAVTPQERLAAFLRGMHETLGFHGDRESFSHYDNHFLHTVIERRRGIPISLILLDILVGRRLDVAIHAVGTPQRALAWFGDGSYSTYIDAFDNGRLMTRGDCIAFLRRVGIPGGNFDQNLGLLNDRGIIERMTHNLVKHAEQSGRTEDGEHLQRLTRALVANRGRDHFTARKEEAPAE
jgi:regulator of sirC expression with transglutaminase-like and TPR domain